MYVKKTLYLYTHLKDSYYLSVTVTLNRCICKMDLKFSRVNTFLISAGNLFHKVGSATLRHAISVHMQRVLTFHT